jgi:hypothetical protein
MRSILEKLFSKTIPTHKKNQQQKSRGKISLRVYLRLSEFFLTAGILLLENHTPLFMEWHYWFHDDRRMDTSADVSKFKISPFLC